MGAFGGLIGGAIATPPALNPITTPSQNLQTLDYYANDVASYGITDACTPSSFYDPIGNKTWVMRQRWDGTIRHGAVQVYDNAAKTFGPTYNALGGAVVDDDHGVPDGVMDDQGYVHIFGDAHSSPTYYSYTTTARNPATFVSYGTIGTTNTYAHPTFVAGSTVGQGQIFLFNRKDVSASTKMQLVLNVISLNNGIPTVGPEIVVADWGTNTRYYQGPHFKIGTVIWHVCTRADYGDTLRQDVFLVGYDTVSGGLVSASGATIPSSAFPVSLATYNSTFRVVNQSATGRYGDIPCLAIDAGGNFVILYPDGAVNTILASPFNLNVMSVSPAGVVGASTTLAVQKDRYDGFTLVNLPDGSIDAYYVLLSNYGLLRGGDMWKTRRSPAGVWGGGQLILAAEPYCSFDQPSATLNAIADIRVQWTENAQPPSTGNTGGAADPTSGLGNGRMYAYGDNGFATVPFALSTQTQALIAFQNIGTPTLKMQKALNELVSVAVNIGAWTSLGAAGLQAAIGAYPAITSAVGSLGTTNSAVMQNALARYFFNADQGLNIPPNQLVLLTGSFPTVGFTGKPAPTALDVSIDGSVFVGADTLAGGAPTPAASSVAVTGSSITTNGGQVSVAYTGVPPTDFDFQIDGAGPFINATNNVHVVSAIGTTNTAVTVTVAFNGATPTAFDYAADGSATFTTAA